MYPAINNPATYQAIRQATTEQSPEQTRQHAPARQCLGALLLGAIALGALPATASATHGSNNGISVSAGKQVAEWPAIKQAYERRHQHHGNQRAHNRGDRHRGDRNRRHSTQVYASVINAEPMYREVQVREPRRECTTEYVPHNRSYQSQTTRRSQNRPSPLLGTIVGGALGNQIGRHFGSSEGRLGATIAGAVIGTALANQSGGERRESRRQFITTDDGHYRERFRGDRNRRNQRGHNERHHDQQRPMRPVERCTTRTIIRTEEQISGYRVTYRYHGRNYRTTTRHHPGDELLIEVNVRPVARR